jgi:hypothetical protein
MLRSHVTSWVRAPANKLEQFAAASPMRAYTNLGADPTAPCCGAAWQLHGQRPRRDPAHRAGPHTIRSSPCLRNDPTALEPHYQATGYTLRSARVKASLAPPWRQGKPGPEFSTAHRRGRLWSRGAHVRWMDDALRPAPARRTIESGATRQRYRLAPPRRWLTARPRMPLACGPTRGNKQL